MNDDDQTGKPSRTVEALTQIAAGTAAVGATHLVGGGVEVDIAAVAATVWGSQSLQALHNRVQARLRVYAPAIEGLGDEYVARVVEEDPRMAALALKAADIAARAQYEEHVDALAAVLHDGLRGDHGTDDISAMMDAIGTMTPSGVLVLQLLAETEPIGNASYPDLDQFSEAAISESLGLTLSEVRMALRNLEDGRSVDTHGAYVNGGELWLATPLAPTVLTYLRDAGATGTAGQ